MRRYSHESTDRRYWLAVVSADHARRGREQGIMQVGHGKGGPLKRPRAGDGVVYYSPTVAMGGKERLQAFTSIGVVADERVYQVDMGGGFRPFRRDARFVEAKEVSILPLLDALDSPAASATGAIRSGSDFSRSPSTILRRYRPRWARRCGSKLKPSRAVNRGRWDHPYPPVLPAKRRRDERTALVAHATSAH